MAPFITAVPYSSAWHAASSLEIFTKCILSASWPYVLSKRTFFAGWFHRVSGSLSLCNWPLTHSSANSLVKLRLDGQMVKPSRWWKSWSGHIDLITIWLFAFFSGVLGFSSVKVVRRGRLTLPTLDQLSELTLMCTGGSQSCDELTYFPRISESPLLVPLNFLLVHSQSYY